MEAVELTGKEAPVVRSILQKAGFEVVGFGLVAAVDLAVVDADRDDPLSLVEELHGRYPEARVLLLSERGEEKLGEIPGYGHVRSALRKPFKRSQLLSSVLGLMERKRVLTA
jgi:hypothetical protein